MWGSEVIALTKKSMSAGLRSGTCSQSRAPYTSARERMPFWSASNLVKASCRRRPRRWMAVRTLTACARCLSMLHSSSREKSLARGVCSQRLDRRRRQASTMVNQMRRRAGSTGMQRRSTLSSAGVKCIAQSRKRQQLCAAAAWKAKGAVQPSDASRSTSCAATQRRATAASLPGSSGSCAAWRRCMAQRIVSASASERITRRRPTSSRRYTPDVSTSLSCSNVSQLLDEPASTPAPDSSSRRDRESSCSSSGSVSVMSSAERSASTSFSAS
mmetsp:Transcript_2904/g.8405  ORF Transcript_2904/g.8405 Transcript_2904/m.8405 type:complete len:272 (-) Transcript_2904:245-1060(-)